MQTSWECWALLRPLYFDIPFAGPMGAVRVGRVNGEFVINPTHSQLDESDIDLLVSGTDDSIASVEGGAHEISEEELVSALKFGHESIKELVEFQHQLISAVGKEKLLVEEEPVNEDLISAVADYASERVKEANRTKVKEDRDDLVNALTSDAKEALAEQFPEMEKEIGDAVYDLVKSDMRTMILKEKKRIDGRALDEVRLLPVRVKYYLGPMDQLCLPVVRLRHYA